MLILTPRVYRNNMSWAIAPQNKIDTISMSPILNTITGDAAEFHTEKFTTCNVRGANNNLPISNTIAPTHRRTMSNSRYVPFETYEFAKARVDVVMATGSRRFTLSTPVNGIPNVSLRLLGTSSVQTRGGSSYNNIPSLSDLKNNNFSLAQWVENNKTSTEQSLTWDYSNNSFSTNPWVRNIKTYPEETVANDILTAWNEVRSELRTFAVYQDWQSESNYALSSSNPSTALPYPSNLSGENALTMLLKIYDDRLTMTVSLNRIDSYTYEVTWTAPVRFTYTAASRMRNVVGTSFDVDNWSFVDNITEVDVVLTGKPYNTDKIAISYSLDDAGNLTENTRNEWPYKIDDSEVITMNSTLNGQDWKTSISKILLDKYKKGKYIVQCDVPAKWVLQNNVHINTQMQIAQQNNTIISRKNVACVFAVKTITKKFKSNEFYYTLGLMEV